MRSFVTISLCLAAAAVCVSAAGYGYYVPRAYYTIDENGQASPLYYVEAPSASRVRRSPQFNGAAGQAGSSASTGAGGNIFFNPLPGFGFGNPGFGFPQNNFPSNYPAQGTSTFTSSSTTTTSGGGGGLDNRFGGDDTKVTGHTQTTTSHNGQFTQTSSHLGDDGKVHFSVQSGKF